MITVNCTTDYTVQSRSIHISWLLNSRQPAIVSNRIRAMRVQRCGAIIKCENGYIHLVNTLFCYMHAYIVATLKLVITTNYIPTMYVVMYYVTGYTNVMLKICIYLLYYAYNMSYGYICK